MRPVSAYVELAGASLSMAPLSTADVNDMNSPVLPTKTNVSALSNKAPRAFVKKLVPVANRMRGKFQSMLSSSKSADGACLALQNVVSYQTIKAQDIQAGDVRAQVLALVQQSAEYRAWLAICADKNLLLDSYGGMLPYADRTLFRIALFGPMGKIAHADALLAKFLSDASAAHKDAVFYQAKPELLAQLERVSGKAYVAYKLGEEAVIALNDFSLEGAARAKLRNFNRKSEREGLRLEVIAKPSYDLLQQCSAISTQWLKRKNAKEKQFSLGFFDLPYLSQTPLAVIYKENNVLAFANLQQAADFSTMSVDLMRFADDAPSGIMDFLFTQLMLWAKAQGYGYFSLGMSPLKDVTQDRYARTKMWPRVAKQIVRHGEHHYNFSGLRKFKDKWQPEWQPRYLLVPHRVKAAPAFLACTMEIAGIN